MARKKKVKIENELEKLQEEVDDEVREVIVETKSGFNTIEVVIIMIISILFGGLLGSVLTYTRGIVGNDINELEELISTYNTIVDTYYDKLDKKELLDSAIKGMVDYLDDPYSVYMDEDASESFNETVNGQYTGIGAQVTQKDGKMIIYSVFDDSPADKAGLQKDDIILSIAGTDVEGKNLSEITTILKGEKAGTKVKMKVERNGKVLDVTLERGVVELSSVESKIIEKNNQKVGVLTVDVFAANTYKQFKKKLSSLEKKKINSLIIDVRGNPGGHLDQVTKVLSLFLDKSKVLYKIENKGKKEAIYSETKEKRKYDIVVLTNKSSASASEILASAIKESYGGKTVGTTTYGKGTVQKAFALESGASIKYTTEKWLTANGNSINEKGVAPDVEVELSEDYINNPSDETDNQLQMALDVITKTEIK